MHSSGNPIVAQRTGCYPERMGSLRVWVPPVVGPLLILACGADGSTEPLATATEAGAAAPISEVPDAAAVGPSADGAPLPDAGPPVTLTAPLRFALIGDYGVDTANEQAVAELVIAESPDFVVTLGDNNYPLGEASTIDAHIGKYYHSFIAPYTGIYGPGATVNRFWPCLGNHDWGTDSMQPYADYFALPGNERYWDLVRGTVHFFCLDSDPHEPDGRTPASVQGTWLTGEMAKSTAPFKFVVMHHPPYSSGEHGSTTTMQWPYASYGADAVFAGHDHTYERLSHDGIPYLVQGTGGAANYDIVTTIPQSVYANDLTHGATFGRADDHFVVFESITTGKDIDDLFFVPSQKDKSAVRRTLVEAGASWSFKDDGALPTAGWTNVGFDASAWKAGAGPFGYGRPGLKTTLSFGGNASQKHVTTWLRRTFDVASVDDIAWLRVMMKKDDGAALYLNGTEIYRTNLPSGALGPQTLARYRVDAAAETAWEPVAAPASLLRVGENVVAIELHQVNVASPDVYFEASVEAVLR